MQFITEAIVIKTRNLKDKDQTADLFTRNHGRLDAIIRSGKKITSRLSPHLEAGSIAVIRITEEKSRTITDALSIHNTNSTHALINTLETCFFLDRMIPYNTPDQKLYEDIKIHIMDEKRPGRLLLSRLGYDPKNATCKVCESTHCAVFDLKTHHFFCLRCGKNKHSETIQIT